MSIPCVLDFASKAARRDVEEQAASAQTADPVEDAPKASERAVGLRFCCLKIPLQTVAFARCRTSSCRRQLWRTRLQPRRQTDVFGKHGRKNTGKHPCTWQDLAAARRARDRAESAVVRADKVVAALWDRWLQEYNANNSEKVDEIETKLKDAETKLEKAKKELKEAEQEYKDAKASVPAGRGQAGASACAVVAVDFGLQHPRVRFRAVHRFYFLGSCSPLGKDSLVVKLHCVGLQHFGEREGALGCFRFRPIWLPFVFCRCFRTGCQS